jgi:hypothetical protein
MTDTSAYAITVANEHYILTDENCWWQKLIIPFAPDDYAHSDADWAVAYCASEHGMPMGDEVEKEIRCAFALSRKNLERWTA